MRENFNTKIVGAVTIRDDLGNVLLEKQNAIHPGNMATLLARGMANSADSRIFKLKLGNQGTYIDNSQQIVFRPPNTTLTSANLYNPTYVEVVDDSSSTTGSGNSVTFTTIPSSLSTRVIITCIVAASEAVNRSTDVGTGGGAVNPNSTYFFDELGLFTEGLGTPSLLNATNELMLSHLVFSPIEHTGNRILTVSYALTVSVS